jgi:SAM-dependent methyltransferase
MNKFKKQNFPWNIFLRERMDKIFSEKYEILDIGGGLRIDPKRNNRGKENAWLDSYLPKVKYIVLDKVADYNPDIVGDVHKLPFEDNSLDAVLCIHLIEHVADPQKAIQEIYRVLKPGGYCYLDTPFLFYYHPMKGYYEDYFRFTRDGWQNLCKDFSKVEIQNVRGAISTAMNLHELVPCIFKKDLFIRLLGHNFRQTGQQSNS